jgi:hypothetical protein
VLAPFPAAYNVYFRKPGAEEEKIEIRTDGRTRLVMLKPGMTNIGQPIENEEQNSNPENLPTE